MPHRRRVRKGSFGGHFDDLVNHFPELPTKSGDEDDGASIDEWNVRDRLLESGWLPVEEGQER